MTREMRCGAPFVVAALLAVLAAGCGGGDREPAGEDDVPVREGRVTLEIGELDGPDEYIFGRVTGLAVDGEGRIHVADQQASVVRVYGADGTHLFSVGRAGQGPGELGGPCCLSVDGRGRLWVRETGNGRYSAFEIRGDSGAAFLEVRRMQHGAAGLWSPLHVVGDSVVDVGAGFGTMDRLRWMVGPDGGVRELPRAPGRELDEIGAGTTVTSSVGESTALRYFYRPFGPRHLLAFGPSAVWAEAVSSSYRVVVHLLSGDSAVVVGPDAPGPALSAAERERAAESIERDREWAGSEADRLDFEVPEHKQPLRDLFFDEEGRLWVERSVADGEPREADVYGLDGSLLERRTWSSDVDLSLPGWVGGDAALGVRLDSLGVQRVVRVEWPAGG